MALPRSIDRPQPRLVHETADACQRHLQRLIGQQTFRMVGRYRQDQLEVLAVAYVTFRTLEKERTGR